MFSIRQYNATDIEIRNIHVYTTQTEPFQKLFQSIKIFSRIQFDNIQFAVRLKIKWNFFGENFQSKWQ